MSGVFKNHSGVFCAKDDGDDSKIHPPPVDCFADLTVPPPTQPVKAGHRYIVENVAGPIHATWVNLPLGLGDGDIIERDFQNLNWLLDLDISVVGEGPIVYVRCRCFQYWYGCDGWVEISPCNFGGYPEYEDFIPTNGQIIFTLTKAPTQPARTIFTVNGIDYDYGLHFNINGTQLTWTNPDIGLDSCDKILVRYC